MKTIRVVLCMTLLLGTAAMASARQTLALADSPMPRSDRDGGARRAMSAIRLLGAAPVIDGTLDDAAWASAAVSRDFVQREPEEGVVASERTEVRILYDDEAIYIGARMFDSRPDSVMASVTRRDEDATSDEVWVQLDSYFDRRTAFVFKVTPSGARADGMIIGGNRQDMGWDAVWSASASRDSLGWVAEIAIPLTQLRFATAAGNDVSAGLTWGLNLTRRIARRNEWSQWSPIPRDAPQVVSHYGELQDLQITRSPRRLEVLPYTVSSITRAPVAAGDPFARRNDVSTSVGADIKYGLTSNVTLNATINPDFGQVEADPSQVNLGVSELFLPEKRPFFLEGMDLFEVGFPQLFYSRRIGRAPQGGVPDAAVYADVPGATRILGAAKLSGKTSSGWSVGVLSALTGAATAQYVDDAGARGEATVEPMTNFLMARVGRELRDGGTRLGATVTAVNRRLDGTDLLFLRESAIAGGFDWQHRFLDAFIVRGTLQASRIAGDSAAIDAAQRSSVRYLQRPDADHLDYDPSRTSMSGYSFFTEITKDRGLLRTGVGTAQRSPGFEINDLGFQFDADIRTAFAWLGYADYQANSLVRYSRATLNLWNAWNFGRERIATNLNLNGSVQLLNYWEIEGMVAQNLGGLDTRALRSGPALASPGGTMSWLQLESNPNAAFSAGVELSGWRNGEGRGGNAGVYPSLSYRPSPRAELSAGPGFSWNDNHSQFVASADNAGETVYIVGRLEQRTASLTARASYAFTPALSFQFYAQPFISAGKYGAFREVGEPRADAFDDRFVSVDAGGLVTTQDGYALDRNRDGVADVTFGNPDFNVKELNTNAVLRWEYRPGSTLFLVWAHGRGGSNADGTFDLRRDASRLMELPSSNTLLLKASYWFNP